MLKAMGREHLWLEVRNDPITWLCCSQTSSCRENHRGEVESIRKRTCYSKVTYLKYRINISLSPFP